MRFMKRLIVVIVSLFSMLSPVFATEQLIIEPTDPAGVSIPEDKKQEWENIRNRVLDEYNVCTEHCGNDSRCLNRCERAYRYRLETEQKKLTQE